MNGETKQEKAVYGLLGRRLGHSFSAAYFTEKFRRQGTEASYRNFEFERIDEAVAVLKSMEGLRGFNVTIPYKEEIIPFLDGLTPEARAIGAVNVVIVRETTEGRRFYGANSDATGFGKSVQPFLSSLNTSVRALILGTGGASKAVDYELRRLGVETMFVSRTKKEEHTLAYSELTAEIIGDHLLIVNATPLGMYPNSESYPPLPYDRLTARHCLFDLVYNPTETRFIQLGRAKGASTKNGLEMLHFQAEIAWEFWQDQGSEKR